MRLIVVSDIKKVWTELSTYILLAVGAFPSVYNELAGMGLVDSLPHTAATVVRGLGVAGVMAKHYRQGWWKADAP
jgi:hypothetical protein